MPKTRPEFWKRKLDRNVERDRGVMAELSKEGWDVLVVWECETHRPEKLPDRLIGFLGR